jgi:hypothetical protein
MLHFDYTWDLNSWGIKLDEELNIDRLGWKDGDYFKVETVNGRRILKKVDPLITFLIKGKENINE